MTLARLLTCAALAAGLAAAQSLDFEMYRKKVEPIFLKKRPGHARCVVCHEANNSAFRLVALKDKTAGWSEEQSRTNFGFVKNLVVPGKPTASKLIMHPLAPDAGGDIFHGGGRQFASQDDPDWKAIAAWISEAKD